MHDVLMYVLICNRVLERRARSNPSFPNYSPSFLFPLPRPSASCRLLLAGHVRLIERRRRGEENRRGKENGRGAHSEPGEEVPVGEVEYFALLEAHGAAELRAATHHRIHHRHLPAAAKARRPARHRAALHHYRLHHAARRQRERRAHAHYTVREHVLYITTAHCKRLLYCSRDPYVEDNLSKR